MALEFSTPLTKEPAIIKTKYFGQGSAYNPNTKTRVDPSLVAGEKTAMIIAFPTQSMSTNCVNTQQTPTSPRVHNFSAFDGGMYSGEDPQFGCSWGVAALGRRKFGGSLFPMLGDKIITGTAIDRVIMAPVGVGGFSIQNEAPPGTTNAVVTLGNGYERLEALLYHMERVGLIPSRTGAPLDGKQTVQTAFYMNIGESDAGGWGGSQALWQTIAMNIINQIRSYDFVPADVPFLITQNTHNFTAQATLIRAAQAALVDNGNHIYSGGDTDVYVGADPSPGANRQNDDVHWNLTGATAAAELYYQSLRALGAHWQ